MSRRDFDKHFEQRPPTAFYIIIGIIVVTVVLLAIFAIDCDGESMAAWRIPGT
jgi:uncharacterized membrane protein YsdA (DUF1294 family)